MDFRRIKLIEEKEFLRVQDKIIFKTPGLYPEGVAWSKQSGNFFIGSVTTSQVGMVKESGNYTVIYSDTSLKSTYGMKVNEAKKQLSVCVSDANYSKFSDASTKRKMAKIIFLDIASRKNWVSPIFRNYIPVSILRMISLLIIRVENPRR